MEFSKKEIAPKIWPGIVWIPLFANGLMGEFVWPFISIILQGNGLQDSSIGLVLGFGNLLPLIFRVPLGYVLDRIASPSRFLLLLFLLPLPLLLIAFTSVHDAFYGVVLALLLWVGRLPYLPLSLALFDRKDAAPATRKALNSFVLVQHFILGIVGLFAGVALYFFSISSALETVGILTLLLNIWIVSTHKPAPDRISPKTKSPRILFPGKAEIWMLLAFFSFHFVNAPLLPFTELFLRGITKKQQLYPFGLGTCRVDHGYHVFGLCKMALKTSHHQGDPGGFSGPAPETFGIGQRPLTMGDSRNCHSRRMGCWTFCHDKPDLGTGKSRRESDVQPVCRIYRSCGCSWRSTGKLYSRSDDFQVGFFGIRSKGHLALAAPPSISFFLSVFCSKRGRFTLTHCLLRIDKLSDRNSDNPVPGIRQISGSSDNGRTDNPHPATDFHRACFFSRPGI